MAADKPDPQPGWARFTLDVHVDDLPALERRLNHSGRGESLPDRLERLARKELRGTRVRGLQVTVVPGERT